VVKKGTLPFFVREPLVHFLAIGGALFAAYALFGSRTGGAPGTIVVTHAQIGSITAEFTRTWLRPPTTEELEELIQDRIREEVYCREAIALGLDKDDAVIRRRLRQKLEFVSEDTAPDVEPTEEDMHAYLKSHPDSFRGARPDGSAPALDDVRVAVRREWANARRLEANEAFYQGLLKRYAVTVER
jgi:hypothetical protein